MPGGRLRSGDMVGPYRVTRLIGEGGMGTVFLAHDDRLGREIALKVLSPAVAGDPIARERLVREARSASRVSHPNVVAIHDVGEAEGDIYLVLEYVDGEPLSQKIAAGPLPPAEVLRLGAQIADALGAAHARGVVHRDIKPANVLVTADGVVKVVDFGLATHVQVPLAESSAGADTPDEARLTRTGYAVGTVAYMSPEQVRGEVPDGRSDLFSLGIVLYEAVSGKIPFQRPSPLATAAAILHDPPQPLRALRTDVPAGLAEVVHRCLEKEPRHRPQTGGAVAEALRLLEAGQATRVVRRALGPKGLPRAVFVGAIGLASVAFVGILGTLASRGCRPVEVEAVRISSPLAKQLHEQSEVYAARGSNRANLVNAADLARRALAAEPAHPRLQAHLAHMVARLQNDDHDPAHTEEIETNAASALASDPSLGEAWFARGWLLLERRDLSGALEAALRGRDLDPRDWAGFAVAGRALVRLGRVEEGLTELRRGLDVPGGHIFVRTVLGYELLSLGRLDESAAEFTRVLEYQPDHPAALGNLASIYLMTGRYLDCIPLYQRLLATQPDAGTASNLGTAFYYLDRIPEAIQAYGRANEMDAHNPAYERNLADAYDRAGASQASRRWYETAVADCERLAREGKATPETRVLHAVLLGRLGKTVAALREADAFVRESPKDMFAIYAAAQIHAMAGRRKETFELTRAAIALGYPREEFRRDPYFGALREDREFLDLLVQ